MVHKTAVGKVGVYFGSQLLHIALGHDDDVLFGLFLAQSLQHGHQLMVGTQNKDVILHAITHHAGPGRIGDIVKDVVEHRDEQCGEQENAHHGDDKPEGIVLARTAEATRVEEQGEDVLPAIVPTEKGGKKQEKHIKHNHCKQEQKKLAAHSVGQHLVESSFKHDAPWSFDYSILK